MVGVLELQCHKQTDSLEAVEPLVDVVAQEHIGEGFHLVLVWCAEALEQSQQLVVPAIHRAEHLDRRT